MNVKICGFVTLVGVLPFLQDLPAPTPLAERGLQALSNGEGSATVAELHAVADFLDALAAHPGMPPAAQDALLTARDALLDRRVRNQHGRTGCPAVRSSGAVCGGDILFTIAATATAGVAVR